MYQADSRRRVTAEGRVRSQAGQCGICGGQSGSGAGSATRISVFSCQNHSTGASRSFITDAA